MRTWIIVALVILAFAFAHLSNMTTSSLLSPSFSSSDNVALIPSSSSSTSAACRRRFYPGEYGWIFKRYVSSGLEAEFVEAVRPMATAVSLQPLIDRFRNATVDYAMTRGRFVPHLPPSNPARFAAECRRYSASARKTASADPMVTRATCLGSQEPLDPYIFSRFEYEFVCLSPPCDPATLPPTRQEGDHHTSFIEPLFGYLRHPRMFYTDGLSKGFVVNREYMIVDKWALNHLYTRWKGDRFPHRNFFYDLGSSTYNSGLGGASQPWFVDMADCMCVPLTHMHMWEATRHRATSIWSPLPKYLSSAYHYFNVPLSAQPPSMRNPLNHLRRQVNPDGSQPVIMKVDFDSPSIERSIIDQLLADPDVHSLIDELFFEHHVILGRMPMHWGRVLDSTSNISSSLELFLSMRHAGIRAHSWV